MKKGTNLLEKYFYPLGKGGGLVVLIIYGTFRKEGKLIWFSLRFQIKKVLKKIIIFLIVFAPFHFLTKFFALLFFNNVPQQSLLIQNLTQRISLTENFFELLVLGLGPCILAPLIEECLFRFLKSSEGKILLLICFLFFLLFLPIIYPEIIFWHFFVNILSLVFSLFIFTEKANETCFILGLLIPLLTYYSLA